MQHLQKTRGGGILPILELIPIPHPAFFSTTYTLPISQALSFDIHPSNGVCVPPSIPSFIKQTPFVAGGKVEDAAATSNSCRGAACCAPARRDANHTRTCLCRRTISKPPSKSPRKPAKSSSKNCRAHWTSLTKAT